MIEGYCTTNLDDYEHEKWPSSFVAVPEKGDYVQAKSGKTLKVVGITHSMNWTMERTPFERPSNETPYVIVELNK